ncbi:MAG TPA: hypothetical protein VG890_08645 [Puia sp.]|nr:hypothetical protein [Puia sp.]
MFIVEELVTQYEAYSDKELYDVHKNIEGYSAEAKEALEKVIRKRGGLESLLARLKDEQRVAYRAIPEKYSGADWYSAVCYPICNHWNEII